MPPSRCPHCGIPLTETERQGKHCPACNKLFSAPVQREPETPGEAPFEAPVFPTIEPLYSAQEIPMASSGDRTGPPFGFLFNWLFGIGTVAIIVFIFLPILDAARTRQQHDMAHAAKLPVKQAERELNLLLNRPQKSDFPVGGKTTVAIPPGTTKDSPPPKQETPRADDLDKAEKKLQEAQKQYEKDVVQWQDAADRAQNHSMLMVYWYLWGMFAGYLLLAIGAIGYLHPRQPTTRRVVGAIIICIQVLFVFLIFAGVNFFATSLFPFGPRPYF
jgi:hypothetical protein